MGGAEWGKLVGWMGVKSYTGCGVEPVNPLCKGKRGPVWPTVTTRDCYVRVLGKRCELCVPVRSKGSYFRHSVSVVWGPVRGTSYPPPGSVPLCLGTVLI